MMKYRKKPVIIDAVKWNGRNLEEVYDFCEGIHIQIFMDAGHNVVIPTLEGNMTCSEGDYIIKGVRGEFYPCKPDIFKQTYELVKQEGRDLTPEEIKEIYNEGRPRNYPFNREDKE